MSALNGLSIAANVLQITGFADTVFRAGRDLYELFDKARSASRNISLLLFELQALLSVVASVHVFATEHASSPFACDDGQTLTNIHTILTLIDQEFRHVRGLLVRTVGSERQGWLSLLQSRILWALKDEEIATSKQRLSQYTQNLTTALSVSGRRNDIVLRTKLQSIEDRLQAISQPSPPRPPDSELIPRPPRTGTTLRVARRQARATYALTQNGIQSNAVGPNRSPRKDLAIIPQGVESEMPHYSSTGNSCPKINISERADRTLVLDTGNYALDEITKPAMLLRDPLVDSLSAKRTDANVAISEPQAEHLQMLIDFLVVLAHTASAEALMKRYGYGSETKLLDRGSPSLKFKGPTTGIEQSGYRSITEESMPVYLEKKSMTLTTRIGSVKATILSARTSTDSTTLVFTLQYAGDPVLGLSAFAVNFMSHALLTALPPLKWRLTRAEIYTKAMARLEDENEVVRWEAIKASVCPRCSGRPPPPPWPC